MQIVIEISSALYTLLQDAKNGSLVSGLILKAAKNGTVLPDNHGRLIDADAFERRCMFDSDIEDMQDVIYALRDYKSIIEADKAESEE